MQEAPRARVIDFSQEKFRHTRTMYGRKTNWTASPRHQPACSPAAVSNASLAFVQDSSTRPGTITANWTSTSKINCAHQDDLPPAALVAALKTGRGAARRPWWYGPATSGPQTPLVGEVRHAQLPRQGEGRGPTTDFAMSPSG